MLNAKDGDYNQYNILITAFRDSNVVKYMIILPGGLICLLGFATYLLPMGNGERSGYISTIILTEVMFLVIVASLLPNSY